MKTSHCPRWRFTYSHLKKIRIILAECCFASKNIPDVDAENIYVLKLNTVQIKYDFQTDFRPFL